MAVLEIVTYPALILRSPARVVEDPEHPEIQKLIDDMADTMYARQGVGLAAVQVNSDSRVIIYDLSEERHKRQYQVVLNPEIVSAEGEYQSEKEGCLSLPEFRTDLKRSARVEVKGLDRQGRPLAITAEDLEAVVLQHETDHLNGILLLDRSSRLKRELYKKKVRKMRKSS
ncbi:MAG: peptide deformylase [Desulfosudaceae bacterium]